MRLAPMSSAQKYVLSLLVPWREKEQMGYSGHQFPKLCKQRKSRKPSRPNTWNSRPTWPLLSTLSSLLHLLALLLQPLPTLLPHPLTVPLPLLHPAPLPLATKMGGGQPQERSGERYVKPVSGSPQLLRKLLIRD